METLLQKALIRKSKFNLVAIVFCLITIQFGCLSDKPSEVVSELDNNFIEHSVDLDFGNSFFNKILVQFPEDQMHFTFSPRRKTAEFSKKMKSDEYYELVTPDFQIPIELPKKMLDAGISDVWVNDGVIEYRYIELVSTKYNGYYVFKSNKSLNSELKAISQKNISGNWFLIVTKK